MDKSLFLYGGQNEFCRFVYYRCQPVDGRLCGLNLQGPVRAEAPPAPCAALRRLLRRLPDSDAAARLSARQHLCLADCPRQPLGRVRPAGRHRREYGTRELRQNRGSTVRPRFQLQGHAAAGRRHRHRRAGRRRQLCRAARGDCSRRADHRRDDVHPLGGRRQNRQPLRHPLPARRRARRRSRADWHGRQNPARGAGDFVKIYGDFRFYIIEAGIPVYRRISFYDAFDKAPCCVVFRGTILWH